MIRPVKNIFLLIFGIFICQNIFSQSDSTKEKNLCLGIRFDFAFEPYNSTGRYNHWFFQPGSRGESTVSFDPAFILNYKKSSLSIGPKIFFYHSDSYGYGHGDVNWIGLRLNYQYTFIKPTHNCNLFLFYEFTYSHFKSDESEEAGCGFASCFDAMRTQLTREFINHEIGIGGRWKWSKDFYFNFSYGIGYQFIESWGNQMNLDKNVEVSNWSEGSLTHINRFISFFRTGLQYDFR